MAYIGDNQILFNAQIHGLVNIDNEYNPESENPQSGIAVAQALSGASGVKYITEYVEAHQLENGIYIIDGDNGGEVFFNNDTIYQAIGTQNLYYGMVLVTTDTIAEAKQITVFAKDENNFTPQIFITYVDGDGNYIDGMTRIFVDKGYVDEQIASLREEIGGIENGSY